MTKDEKEVKSQIANWLIDVLGQTDITNNSLNELIDNEYDNYVMKQDYEKRISELESELYDLTDKYNHLYDLNGIICDNTLKVVKKQCDITSKKVRHEICEKIRNAGECSTEWIYDLKSEKIVGYFVSTQLLDRIERGEE